MGVYRWILVAVMFVDAVLAVATGGIWLAKRYATPVQGLAPAAGSRGTTGNRLPIDYCSRPFSPQPRGISPDRSPEITDITALDRTTVRVRWVNRSRGTVNFLVAHVCENGRMINAYGAPDTEYVFKRLDPATAPYCFQVEALTVISDWYSPQRCVSPPR